MNEYGCLALIGIGLLVILGIMLSGAIVYFVLWLFGITVSYWTACGIAAVLGLIGAFFK